MSGELSQANDASAELEHVGDSESVALTVVDDASASPSVDPVVARRDAAKRLKREKDAANARLRRQQKKIKEAKSVAELEELERAKSRDGSGDESPAQKPGNESGALVATQPTTTTPTAPRPMPSDKSIAAFRPVVAGIVESLSTILENATQGDRWKLEQKEKESIVDPGAVVAAKYLPEDFTTPEAQLALAVFAVIVPRAVAELGEWLERNAEKKAATPTTEIAKA